MDLLDDSCVQQLAIYHGHTEAVMARTILEVQYYCMSNCHKISCYIQWNYDHVTATYFLLQQQKMSGKPPLIIAPPKWVTVVGWCSDVSIHRKHGLGPPRPSPLVRVTSKKQDLSSLTDSSESDEEEIQQPSPPPAPARAPRYEVHGCHGYHLCH